MYCSLILHTIENKKLQYINTKRVVKKKKSNIDLWCFNTEIYYTLGGGEFEGIASYSPWEQITTHPPQAGFTIRHIHSNFLIELNEIMMTEKKTSRKKVLIIKIRRIQTRIIFYNLKGDVRSLKKLEKYLDDKMRMLCILMNKRVWHP